MMFVGADRAWTPAWVRFASQVASFLKEIRCEETVNLLYQSLVAVGLLVH
jgi:hypothetical protein